MLDVPSYKKNRAAPSAISMEGLGYTSGRGLGCVSAAIFCIYNFRRSAYKNFSPSDELLAKVLYHTKVVHNLDNQCAMCSETHTSACQPENT
jgi:hypothetical protein